MSFDILYKKSKEGVMPGGLYEREQIKVLICYLINETDYPASSELLCGVLQKCGVANYFDSTISFSELVTNGQLIPEKENSKLYKLSESGKFIVHNLADEVPVVVRDETLKSYKLLLNRYDVQQENTANVQIVNSRAYVECTVNDGDDMLMKLNVYMPNVEQAEVVKNVFYNNTDVVYQAIVAIMTGDKKTALEVLSSAQFNKEGLGKEDFI